MTFLERYNQETTWYGKVMVMEIYHLAMSMRERNWTITRTATDFNCSIGLVSENLKLAFALHDIDSELWKCESRQDALKKFNTRKVM